MNPASVKPPVYSGVKLLQIAFPMGGIGAGSISLTGQGGLEDFSIRNCPGTTAAPDGHTLGDAAFALLHVKGKNPVTRLLEGPLPVEKIYNLGLQSQGYRKGAFEGLPRFQECAFSAYYPFGEVRLSDPKIPVTVNITGWNPFIPLDDVNSGIPCAILEYTLENKSDAAVVLEFSYHLSHLAPGASGWEGTRNERIDGAGVFFRNLEDPRAETFGSASLLAIEQEPRIKAMWLRGGWFDSVSSIWRQVSEGRFAENGGCDKSLGGRNGGSILIEAALAPGESVTLPLVIAWHFPNSYVAVGNFNTACSDRGCEGDGPAWRPFYVNHWKDAREVGLYVRDNYVELRRRTRAFQEALVSSTLPREVIEAVSANLAILKSPTVLRQENGNVWAWEGCFTAAGCCSGTCTHVWNYAQALPHLYPALERTLREQELCRGLDERGHVDFRAALPDGPTGHAHRAAADGQLGGVLKLYRDWQISGDTEWMRKLLPLARRSLEYCVATWDPDRRGALFEPHHNTYDIEFWGPDGMCTSIYVAALAAMAEMTEALGEEGAEVYRELSESGAAVLDQELFNGEYFEQKVTSEGLRDQSFQEYLKSDSLSEEERELAQAEGPKYQYGSGCLSDGVIGAWMAKIYGIASPQNRQHIRSNLRAIFRYNFREDLSEHANPQRPGYALGHEAGLLLCSWPRGGKPTLPFVYSDEVWTGIEYQVASHLIEEEMVEEGLRIVRAARSRYDGRSRNPFNEYECGSFYARALASYALLGSLAGFRYSAVSKTLWFGPRIEADPFQVFFSTASGWGTIRLTGEGRVAVRLEEGELRIKRIVFIRGEKEIEREWEVTIVAGSEEEIDLARQ